MKLSHMITVSVVILIVSIVGGISYFLINNFQEILVNHSIEEIEHQIQQKSQTLENYLDTNSDKIKLYMIFPEIQGLLKFSEFGESFNFDKQEWVDLMVEHFEEIQNTNPDIEQIRILDIRGKEIVRIDSDDENLRNVSESELQNKSDQIYFKDTVVLSKNQVYLSDIELDENNGQVITPHKTTLRFVTLITDGSGENMGMMVINHNMDGILSSIADTNIGKITIVDNNGMVIFGDDTSQLFGSQLETGYNYFKENNSFMELLDDESNLYDEKNQTYKFWEKITNPHDPKKFWIIISEISQSTIMTPIQDTVTNLYYFVIISLGVTITVTLIISNLISRPFEKMIRGIKLVKSGNYDEKIQVSGSDEITEIGDTFNDLTSILKVQKQMSDRFSNNLDVQIREVSFMNEALDKTAYLMKSNCDGNITYVNDRFCKLSGYTKDELIGENPRILKSGEHPPEFYKDMWDTITTGNVWYGDTKNKRKDDSTYWTRKIIIPKKDIDGKIIEYLAIQTDITNEAEHKIELENAVQEQIEKRTLESEFTKMISHDLRDPISIIYGNCEILKNTLSRENISDEHKKILDSLYVGAKKLDSQIDELLSIYKIDSHKLHFKKSLFTVYLIAEQVILNHSTKAKEEKIKLINEIDPLLRVISDEVYISQILGNLILNALEFAPKDGGIIRIGAKIQDDDIVFQIQDNGAGFSPEDQKNLFKKFYELDTTHSRNHKPYEMRLVRCRGIIEELDGKIWVESHLGFGSTFFFSIPVTEMKTQ